MTTIHRPRPSKFTAFPVDNVMIGGEVIWGKRENFLDKFTSDDVHFQFSFKYNFKKELKF